MTQLILLRGISLSDICDLFFADAAILVEGNVERLLMSQLIEKSAPGLKSICLTILEIGGAFGHRFKSLIDFLGLTTLIITDIDSVVDRAPDETSVEGRSEEADEDEVRGGTACAVSEPGAVTSNQALIQWLPKLRGIQELLAANASQKTQERTSGSALVHVTYQTPVSVTWNGATQNLTARTLEEAFAIENLDWCQNVDRADLGLRIRNTAGIGLEQLAHKLYQRVKKSSFKKTDFALALLGHDPSDWKVPAYIESGLSWLEAHVHPVESTIEQENTAPVTS
jgi:hypothetical protein